MLLQKQIIKVDRIGKASLGLYFESNGYVMLDGDNSPYYEAYTICIPGEDIYVV